MTAAPQETGLAEREPTEKEVEAVRKAIFGYHNNESDFLRLPPSQQDDWRRMARDGARALCALTKAADALDAKDKLIEAAREAVEAAKRRSEHTYYDRLIKDDYLTGADCRWAIERALLLPVAGEREKGLEEAALWHDQQAARYVQVRSTRRAQAHRYNAAQIRSLISPPPLDGEEGLEEALRLPRCELCCTTFPESFVDQCNRPECPYRALSASPRDADREEE